MATRSSRRSPPLPFAATASIAPSPRLRQRTVGGRVSLDRSALAGAAGTKTRQQLARQRPQDHLASVALLKPLARVCRQVSFLVWPHSGHDKVDFSTMSLMSTRSLLLVNRRLVIVGVRSVMAEMIRMAYVVSSLANEVPGPTRTNRVKPHPRKADIGKRGRDEFTVDDLRSEVRQRAT